MTRLYSFEFGFVLATLATWRVTHLVVAEDGPADAVLHLRRLAGVGFWGRLMDCFYCTSLWVAAPTAALMTRDPLAGALTWLAISGGACLLERVSQRPELTKGQDGPAHEE